MVLTWNDGPLLDLALRSALESEDVDVRVIVVDNGSIPAAEVPDDPRVQILRSERNLGVAMGRTVGVAASTADTVCFLDSDARLRPETLRVLVDVVEQHERVGLAAPVFEGQVPADSGGRAPTVRTKLSRALNLRSDYEPLPEREPGIIEVDFAIGACQLFTREAWGAVAGLDVTYFYGPEDVDFCLRLREAGYRVVQVVAAVCHHPPRRRFKNVLTRHGVRHGAAVARHLWRHRRYRSTG